MQITSGHSDRRNTEHRPRVLVVDDDKGLLELLHDTLGVNGYDTTTISDGLEAVRSLRSEHFDLIILDLRIPGKSGLEVLAEIRCFSHLPIIILSGWLETQVKVTCLSLGADDYVTKPFYTDELVARCRLAIRHRSNINPSSQLEVSGVRVDFYRRDVFVDGLQVSLTKLEFNMLRVLIVNAGKVLDYDDITERVWARVSNETERDSVHRLIRRLRAKIEIDPANPRRIISIPGVGYMLRDAP